jgi:protein-tyrosine-phosphatase
MFSQEKAEPKVLFVCEHGAAKSIIAVAHFNKLAKERGLPHRAVARGTHPDPTFAPKAISGLKAEGLTAPKGTPTLVPTKMWPNAACRDPRMQAPSKDCRYRLGRRALAQ